MRRIDRMDEIEIFHSLLCLIRLQMTDEMPCDLAPQRLILPHRLLDAVFADIRDACVDGLAHGGHIVILRDGDKLDILRDLRCPARLRRLDFLLYFLKLFCNHE